MIHLRIVAPPLPSSERALGLLCVCNVIRLEGVARETERDDRSRLEVGRSRYSSRAGA